MLWWIVGIVVVLLILYISLFWWHTEHHREVHIKGSKQRWFVLSDYANSEEAAHMLEKLNEDCMKLFSHLQKKYYIDETQDQITADGIHRAQWIAKLKYDQVGAVNALLDGYDFESTVENRVHLSTDTSYTVDKGKAMHLCLRQGDNPENLVDYDLLFFVFLHECSHIANYKNWGHDDMFWSTFKWILAEAKEANVHNPVDYSKAPTNYCKLFINYSPYYDTSLPVWFVPKE